MEYTSRWQGSYLQLAEVAEAHSGGYFRVSPEAASEAGFVPTDNMKLLKKYAATVERLAYQ